MNFPFSFELGYSPQRFNSCNGMTACVTCLVMLIVCILGVILERAMLYQNVRSNGREQ